jgi:hypothetical protein
VIITNIKYVLGENIQIKIKKGKKHILDFGCIRRSGKTTETVLISDRGDNFV